MKNKNIGVLTFPIGNAGITPLSNLLDIICSISRETYLITGNDGYLYFRNDGRFITYGIDHEYGTNVFTRVLKYIRTQLKISYNIVKIYKSVDIWVFFIGGEFLIFPMLTSKLLNKKVVLIYPGSITQSLKSKNDMFFNLASIVSKINCNLSDRIVLYSHIFVEQWNLNSYINKISISHRHFLDFNKFFVKKHFSEKNNSIGYIGRFSNEKGTMNFVKSIPLLLEKTDCLNFLLIGDGNLKSEIIDFLDKNGLANRVEITGWIQHEDLPNYLNNLKLVVLPSYTEGLPNLMLESMACGTPVLATSVGAIPDVIKDGETGFIMKDNSPDCIAKSIIRALEHPDLELIVENARKLICTKFTYEFATENYRQIIENI
ncbi:glycosyltransferase family 4 protein [Methanosarcina sp. 2.H.A.1B.4]|uniref:glycosyltransferase family 4 protein n=1 Tax=Methanosarcina sp. 2.H.A.1B.4 TaxID=1483600 RepID=UPI000622307F|nr:glycosyltransferase [Methanosarcina sp. 2.H.A.1B.4]KKG09292.1 hypothetical protein EO92_06115 [Methanosarcina sp. 2.H.A.1B.4]